MPLDLTAAVVAALRGEPVPAGTDPASLAAARRAFFARRVPPLDGAAGAPVRAAVRIVTDEWGTPHVFADNAWDLYLGFGFVTGRERLWQLDYLRRASRGTLAEILGPGALRGDIEARTVDLAGIAAREWETQSAEVREALEAYTAGINFAREQALSQDALPVEFALLGYEPHPWSPLDTLANVRAIAWQFSGRLEGIVLAEAAQRYLPPALAEQFLAVEAADQVIAIEPLFGDPGDPPPGAGLQTEPATPDSVPGSNQFTAGPSRTASGKPILASDGHISYTQPSSLFELHLCGAGYDVTGVVKTGLPYFQIGRNRRVAWGNTNNVSSARDLYVETVDPDRPDLYRDGDSWRPFDTRTEVIRVRDAADHTLVVCSTVRGPIVNHLISRVDPDGDPPLSLRWTGFTPEDSVGVGMDVARAASAEEHRAVQSRHRAAGSNPGFADVDGHIGYQMRGRYPIRGRIARGFRRADEPLDEWQGFIPYEQLPAERDPRRGWTGSANNRPAAPTYPIPLYGSYADGQRMRRIRALLDGATNLTPAHLGAMQNDTFSNRAADVCPHLIALLDLRLAHLNETARAALAHLRQWDYRFDVDRTGASVFQAFWLAWTARIAAARFPAHLARQAASGCSYVAHRILTAGDGVDGAEPWFPRDRSPAEIEASFQEAVTWLRERLGDDPSRWTWGDLHPVTFRHPLASRFPACTELSVGPFPCPGSTGVLNQNGFTVRDRYEVTGGPHFRLLVDLATPHTALGAHTTGNSGHPASPYYANHTADWLAGRYHPLHMHPATIQSHAAGTFALRPH